MKWRWWRRERLSNGEAKRAKVEAQRKLGEVRQDWPQVHRAHDQLAEWIDAALRGQH